ncbi:hypothetical protein IGI37_000212 [Enterococcus sp. AZ194]
MGGNKAKTEKVLLSNDKNTVENIDKNQSIHSKQLKKLKEYGIAMSKEYETKEQIITTSLAMVEVNTMEDVEDLTEIGIEGVVMSAEPFVFHKYENGAPFTKIVVHVRTALHNSEELVGKEITIYEPGGLITKEELGFLEKRAPEAPTLSQEELSEEVVVNINGIKNSFPGDEVALYLVKVPGNELGLEEDFYQIMADYLTRFDKNDETELYERPDTEIVSDDSLAELQENPIEIKDLELLNETISEIAEEKEG